MSNETIPKYYLCIANIIKIIKRSKHEISLTFIVLIHNSTFKKKTKCLHKSNKDRPLSDREAKGNLRKISVTSGGYFEGGP